MACPVSCRRVTRHSSLVTALNLLFEHSEVVAVAEAGGDVVVVAELQLGDNFLDLHFFGGGDGKVGCGNGEEAIEERELLSVASQASELARHQKILRATEE